MRSSKNEHLFSIALTILIISWMLLVFWSFATGDISILPGV